MAFISTETSEHVFPFSFFNFRCRGEKCSNKTEVCDTIYFKEQASGLKKEHKSERKQRKFVI